jgi:hypothetical protein
MSQCATGGERHCIYCAKLKDAAEFSLEHLIPRFMGGSASCKEAVTKDVCRRCNVLCGRYVDAPVARGLFHNSFELGAHQQCVRFDAAEGNVFSLSYFGTCTEILFSGTEEAEVWLAPDGGTVWHIRTRQPADFATMAGGDPVLGRKDSASRVYSFNASEHPYWIRSNFKSVMAHFHDKPIFWEPTVTLSSSYQQSESPARYAEKMRWLCMNVTKYDVC